MTFVLLFFLIIRCVQENVTQQNVKSSPKKFNVNHQNRLLVPGSTIKLVCTYGVSGWPNTFFETHHCNDDLIPSSAPTSKTSAVHMFIENKVVAMFLLFEISLRNLLENITNLADKYTIYYYQISLYCILFSKFHMCFSHTHTHIEDTQRI